MDFRWLAMETGKAIGIIVLILFAMVLLVILGITFGPQVPQIAPLNCTVVNNVTVCYP